MRIGGSQGMAGGEWGFETTCREVEHGNNLFPRHADPLHDFFDTCAGFEVLENSGNRHASVLKHPRAAALAGDAFDRRTLGPIENCHISLPSDDLSTLE